MGLTPLVLGMFRYIRVMRSPFSRRLHLFFFHKLPSCGVSLIAKRQTLELMHFSMLCCMTDDGFSNTLSVAPCGTRLDVVLRILGRY
jgi:hypothetical protein